jgi:hypothetical protein
MIEELTVKDFYLFFSFAWTVLAGVRLYRAYAGTMPGWIVSLNHSRPVTMSNRQRWVNAAFGICYLGFGIMHMIFYMRLAHPSG